MDRDPQKFYYDDVRYYPANFGQKEVFQRFHGRPVDEPEIPVTLKPTNVAFLDATIHELSLLVRAPPTCTHTYNQGKQMRPIRGALLSGPSGTGKSMVSSALCTECDLDLQRRIAFCEVKLPLVLSSNPINSISKYFDMAAALKPSILYIDHLDKLLEVTGMTGVLQTLIDGVSSSQSVFVLAATCHPHIMSCALGRSGRLGKVFEFHLPDHQERRQWLEHFTELWNIDRAHLEVIAGKTDGLCARELSTICQHAHLNGLRRINPTLNQPDSTLWLATGEDVSVNSHDLDRALERCNSSKPGACDDSSS